MTNLSRVATNLGATSISNNASCTSTARVSSSQTICVQFEEACRCKFPAKEMRGSRRVAPVGREGEKQVSGGGGNPFKDAIAFKTISFHDQFISHQPNGPHSYKENDTPGDVREGCGVFMGGHLLKPTECVAAIEIVG